MKRVICALLSAFMIAAFAGCAARQAGSNAPESEASVSSSQAPSEPESNPESSSAPESSENAQEESYPVPELNDMDRAELDANIQMIVNFFGGIEEADGTWKLEKEDVLFFCLAKLYQQQEMQGYLFESGENEGDVYVPQDLVAAAAQQYFGLPSFSCTDSTRYQSGKQVYVYNPGHGGLMANYKIPEIQGAPDGNIAYDVVLYGIEDEAMAKEPLRTTRFTCKLLRQNGIPYLQLVSIMPVK